ncbi:MAG: helix-turn-helix transcriptional regulator [Spirochaetes bacterium]|nr:helix-turn-helix transcriptional regulator [Spirochaetota bacterium]
MAIQELDFPADFPAILFTYDIPRELKEIHYHDCLEVGLIETGTGTFWIGEKKVPFSAGDLFLINKLEGHRAHAAGSASVRARFLYLSDRFLEMLLPFAPGVDFLRLFSLGGPRFENRFRSEGATWALRAAVEEANSGDPHGKVMARLHVARLLVELTRHFKRQLPAAAQDAFCEKLPGLLDHILTRLDSPLPAAELAARTGLSEAHFRKRFKAYTGKSPREWVEERRLFRAHILLASKGYPTRRAAEESGFADYSAFQRQFKKRFGLNPAEVKLSSGPSPMGV